MNSGKEAVNGVVRESRELAAREDTLAMLLGTVQDWFASALRAVLEPEGFTVYRAHSSEDILSFLANMEPDAVLLDEGLPPVELPELCRMLLDGPLPRHIPLLYHFSGSVAKGDDVEMLQAGAWAALEDPVRPASLVAQLRRFRNLGQQMVEGTEEQRHVDPDTELLTLTGLMRILPLVVSLARRRGRPLTYTALGPTELGSGRVLTRQRRSTAELCRRHLRRSDFVGWLNDGDIAVITYGVSKEEGGGLARRLNDLAEAQTRAAELRYTLSAGVIEVEPSRQGAEARNGGNGNDRSNDTTVKLETLHALAAAQTALQKARSAGGGIRFVDVT